MLNLDASNMPAGEAVELAASKATQQDPAEKKKHAFTVPLKGVKDCNFSFSGLKAQVFRQVA